MVSRCIATPLLHRLHPVESAHFCVAGCASVQKRWWWDVGANARKHDKPLMTGTKHVYVKNHIPVVLLETLRGLGMKGQIVHVKRGYARHQLIPKGRAVLGTWENIDEFADPDLVEDLTLKGREVAQRGRLPFDWINSIQLTFTRWAREDQPSTLAEPITVWEILEELSAEHELDLLPANLDVPEDGFSDVGEHEISVRVAFRSPEMAAGRYTIRAQLVSQQSLIEEQRREEMARTVAASSRFALPKRGPQEGHEDYFAEELAEGGGEEEIVTNV